MLPFSKRPPAPEEYFLNSGDFQAVQPHPAPLSVRPMAQPQPIFARQRQATPYGFVQQYGSDLNSVPPPPHSLAPVAMGSHGATITGSHREQPQVTLKEKPSLKWGLMIALTGAVLGGVIGVGMDAKRQQQAAASQGQDSAPVAAATAQAAPAQAQGSPFANNLVAKPAAPPQAAPVLPTAPTAGGLIGSSPVPNVIPQQAPVVVGPGVKDGKPAPGDKAEAKTKAKPTFAGGRHFRSVRPAQEDPPEPAPAPVVKKAAPAPAAAAPAPEPEKKKPAAPKTDAQKVLEDAIKNTANTL